jgi:hypothetical protein
MLQYLASQQANNPHVHCGTSQFVSLLSYFPISKRVSLPQLNAPTSARYSAANLLKSTAVVKTFVVSDS